MLSTMRGGSATATGSAPTVGKQSNKASNPRPSAKEINEKEINEMGGGLAFMFAAFFAWILLDMAVAL